MRAYAGSCGQIPAGKEYPEITIGDTDQAIRSQFGRFWAYIDPVIVLALLLTTDPGHELFERSIRPMLLNHCVSCHGEDKIRGGLVLSTPEGLAAGGDTGAAVVPRNPDASRLLEALEYHNPDFRMPPDGRLPSSTIADVKRWIELGAPDPRPLGMTIESPEESALSLEHRLDHWAYREMARTAPPEYPAAHPIDQFVRQRLEDCGGTPSPPAEDHQILRRLHLSLTGMPPTLDDLRSFAETTPVDRIASAIDELLDSPHYGERWARHWMDVTRYADSNGLDENTAFANAWQWRDWIIRALNDDLPYDNFVKMQLAGDLLPATNDRDIARDRITATGFLGLGPKVLAEPDKIKMRADIVDEQIDTIGKTFLGQTVGCARCHDHKFDPIPTRDYYALAGIFHSTQTMATFNTVARVLEQPAAHPQTLAERKKWEQDVSDTEAFVADLQKKIDADLQDQWLLKLPEALEAVAQLPHQRMDREAEAFDRSNLNQDFDHWGPGIGVIHTTRPNELQFVEWDVEIPASGRWTLSFRYACAEARPVRMLIDGKEISSEVIGTPTGSFMPDGQQWVDVFTTDWAAGPKTIRLERQVSFPHIDRISLRPEEIDHETVSNLKRISKELNVPFGFMNRLHQLHAWSSEANGDPKVTQAKVRLVLTQSRGLSNTNAEVNPHDNVDDEAKRQQWLVQGPFAVTDDERRAVNSSAFKKWHSQRENLSRLRESEPPAPPETISVRDETNIRSVRVHARGDHTHLVGPEIPRGFLKVSDHLVPAPKIKINSGRLALADWMLHPEHPLTARVMVNRVWQGHFGVGLVNTPSDFGTRGGTPTHPELLDWLARWFIQDGWSLKRLHRLILTSETWQQASTHRPDMALLDPDNQLLWRSHRRRYEAEAIRDAILTTSDGLDRTMGGSLLSTANFAYVNNDQSASNESYEDRRRSVYLPVIRNDMYDLYSIFDYPDASVSFGRRPSTVVSSQALFFLNAPLVLEEANRLAKSLTNQSDDESLEELWQRVYARSPKNEEKQRALALLNTLDRDEEPISAWSGLIQSLFASSEFIYLD